MMAQILLRATCCYCFKKVPSVYCKLEKVSYETHFENLWFNSWQTYDWTKNVVWLSKCFFLEVLSFVATCTRQLNQTYIITYRTHGIG